MGDIKDIRTLVSAYMENLVRTPSVRYYREWPAIAGPSLRRLTEFARLDGSRIMIYAEGSSARNLVLLEKRRLLRDFNRRFPEAGADDIVIIRK